MVSDTGHALVRWEATAPVTLVISNSADFAGARVLYHGDNHSYFLSGLANGNYHLLLRDEAGGQSAAIQLTVEHQSLTRALWLVLAGAVVALGIVLVILRGARS